jgi:hypothetical protein
MGVQKNRVEKLLQKIDKKIQNRFFLDIFLIFVVAYFSGIPVGSLRAHSAAHPHLVSTFF